MAIEKKELAGEKNNILTGAAYAGANGLKLMPTDDVLLIKGQGRGLKIYDELERDAQVYAALQQRKMAVVSYPWEVTPASNSLKDRKCAEFITKELKRINFDKLSLDLLDAILKGFSVAEVMWQVVGENVLVDKIITRDQRRFSFDDDHNLRLLTSANPLYGDLLPPNKFIHHATGAKDGSPYGLGLGEKLFWPVWFKKQNINFWLRYADKFSFPTLVGKYPQGTQETEQQAFLQSISSLSQDAAIAMVSEMELSALETNQGAAGSFYENVIRYFDEQITLAILTENATTSGKSQGLGSNQSAVHNEIRLELARHDADLLSATLNNTLIQWLTDYNYPSASAPKVWRKIEVAEDLNARANRDAVIKGLGFTPSVEYIQSTYGADWQLAQAPAAPLAGAAPAQFAESPPQRDAIDDLVDEALNNWVELVNPVATAVQAAMDEAQKTGETAQSFLNRLPDILSAAQSQALADNLGQAAFAAHLAGQAQIELD